MGGDSAAVGARKRSVAPLPPLVRSVASWYRECSQREGALGFVAREIARVNLGPGQGPFLDNLFFHIEPGEFRVPQHIVDGITETCRSGVLPGAVYEACVKACQPELRHARGLVYTPQDVATSVLDSVALSDIGDVLDPSCGAGVFLTTLLSRSPLPAREKALSSLYGFDIDQDALALARALLFTISGSRDLEVVNGLCKRLTVNDVTSGLSPQWESRWSVVIGNPPFLSPLRRRTVMPKVESSDLYHSLGVATTDVSALFVLRAAQMCAPGGRVVLILPRSFAAGSGGERVRAALDAGGNIEEIIPLRSESFKVGAHPILLHYRRNSASLCEPIHRTSNWGSWLATAPKLPPIGEERLGSLASFRAGHRDEYYEIAKMVYEHGQVGDTVKVWTTGMLGLNSCKWGRGEVRIAKRDFLAPVVPRMALRAKFHTDQLCAKILVPPQKRVLMPVIDADGCALGLVPLIAGIPRAEGAATPSQLASAVASPISCALIETSCAGLGLSPRVLRFRSADLASLPLPQDKDAWDEGASLYAVLDIAHEGAVRKFGETMANAYGLPGGLARAVMEWWGERMT